jgi:arsenite/tail-anchored protein-transporting ATPase
VAPRIVLHTGKGGVGKTSVAAATARRAAVAGARTLVLSTDPSLAGVLGAPAGSEPTAVADGLWAERIDAEAELERHWPAAVPWLSGPLVPPGLDELLTLLRLRAHADADDFDVVVVDCAPLRLLSLPDVARTWLDRAVSAAERGALDAARPFARAVLDVALPGDDVVADVTAAAHGVLAMGDVLRDAEHASVRIVTTPERLAADEARRTFTYLNLYGFPVDAVLVNRVAAGEDHAARAHEIAGAFAPVPVLRAPSFAEEVRGIAMLDRLGDAAFGDRDPAAVLHSGAGERLEVSADSATLRLPLPLARRGEVSLRQVGAELVVRVHDVRRTLLLPPALHGWSASGAELADGALTVALEAPVA